MVWNEKCLEKDGDQVGQPYGENNNESNRVDLREVQPPMAKPGQRQAAVLREV
jgi:hypothetical protein